ncbi:MAG: tetratricopeptide repeat protein [Blastocatellia bacterium]|nr:tetratricopeptide repeat protein [Blastocatellia bacterium]MBL8192922.1 tetratricopeptide repeat protein [Blastocatellia bacterium]MBN8722162.1 tetratricopeptide repeat protein [Acidobacteriota bacterium]
MSNLAVEVSQEELTFLMEAATIYRDAGKYQQAREVVLGLIALRPESDIPLVTYGTILFAENNFDEAIEYYKSAIEKNSASAYAYVHLGEAYFMKKDFSIAREHLTRAIELSSDGPHGQMAKSILEVIE